MGTQKFESRSNVKKFELEKGQVIDIIKYDRIDKYELK